MELNPTSRSGKTTYTDVVKIAIAQGRSHIQSLLKNVLYVDNNKKRVKQWLNANRLQLPLRSTTANSTNNIPQNAEKSNTKKSIDVNHYMTAAENGDEETASNPTTTKTYCLRRSRVTSTLHSSLLILFRYL